MEYPYWQEQSNNKPLFPDIIWNKPQQKNLSGNLAIIGGSKQGFNAIASSYQQASSYGAGEVKLFMPDTLKPLIPKNTPDILFGQSTSTGSLAKSAGKELKTLGEWAGAILFIGDSGKNSETSLLFEGFISEYERPIVIARDTIDLLMQDMKNPLNKDNVVLFTTLAQLQKIFRTTYYPKMITFSLQLTNLIEILHKFTLTYPVTIVTYHAEKVVIANQGQVVTTNIDNPMPLWSGDRAIKASCQLLWSPTKPLEAVTSSML